MTKNNMHIPDHHAWDRFWRGQPSQGSSSVSWSKRRILKIVQPYLIKNSFVLDAGSGSGFFSKCFCDSGMQTTALDYSDESLRMTSDLTEGRVEILKRDLIRCDLSRETDKRFDLIFSDGLFEHFSLEGQDVMMKNLSGVLSNKGVIITFVPNRFSPWELIRPFYMPGIEESPFTLKELVWLNKRNHLEVIQKGGINTFPFFFSPDIIFGKFFGMLLFTIARRP